MSDSEVEEKITTLSPLLLAAEVNRNYEEAARINEILEVLLKVKASRCYENQLTPIKSEQTVLFGAYDDLLHSFDKAWVKYLFKYELF